MRTPRFLLGWCLAGGVGVAAASEAWLDRMDEALTWSFADDRVRTRVSGLADLEAHLYRYPAPSLLESRGDGLLNGRLSLFLDAQVGSKVYLFAQSRLDRGFDATDRGPQARGDEYAVRFTPWEDGRFSLQAGKFATVVGNWVERHLSWDNPFINAPLVYEHATGIDDGDVHAHLSDFRHRDPAEKYEHLPVLWGPAYASGFSAAGRIGKFEYALEVKNGGPSSRPEIWSWTDRGMEQPTVAGRVAYRPNPMWTFGVSGSEGPYLLDEAASVLPAGRGWDGYRHRLVGQDVKFAWHHLQVWAEVFESRFQLPLFGDADSLGYYLETRYKLGPRMHVAVRWNQDLYGKIGDGSGQRVPWSPDLWRIDTAVGFRLTPHMQLKLQHNVLREDFPDRPWAHVTSAQFTLRF